MKTFKNIYVSMLVFVAAAVFSLFTVGGEFLHERLHQHADDVSHQECWISHFQSQAFLLICAFVFAVVFKFLCQIARFCAVYVSQSIQYLPYLRGPPVVHS